MRIISIMLILVNYILASPENGFELYNSKQYSKAKIVLEKMDANGDMLATYYLGKMYYLGEGVKKDCAKAKELYFKAADNDNMNAMMEIPTVLESCSENNQNNKIKTPIEELEKMAKNNVVDAQFEYGEILIEGQNQDKIKEGIVWLTQAADKGYVPAQQRLASYLFNDYRLAFRHEKNRYQKSFDYFMKAAKQNDSYSQYRLGMMYFNGIGTERNEVEAFFWIKKSLDETKTLEYPSEAMYELGKMYAFAIGTDKNIVKAKYYFAKAAYFGSDMSMLTLSKIYLEENNYIASFLWANRAYYCNYTNPESVIMLAKMYAKGIGTQKDYKRSENLINLRLSDNNPKMYFEVAKVYLSGEFLLKDENKAFSLFQKAASLGSDVANYQVIIMYCEGIGTKKDLHLASKLAKKEQEKGNEIAYIWNKYQLWKY